MFYHFGEYLLDLETRKLLLGDTVVSDDGKIIQLLQALCASYPEVAEKQFLIDSLWPDQVVTDWSLSRLVSDTRQLLGDSGKDQGFIKTVRGRGFRLNTHVEKLEERSSKPTIKSADPSSKGSKKYKLFAVITSLTAILITTVLLLKPNNSEALPELPLRVAVLPITSSSNEPIDEWLKYGIMSLVVEQLGQYKAINTLPVASVITALSGLGEDFAQQPMGVEQFETLCGQIGCTHVVVVKYALTESMNQALTYQILRKKSRSAINEFTQSDVIDAADMLLDHLASDLLPIENDRLSLKETYSTDNKANRDYAIGVHELHNGDIASAKSYLQLALKRQPDFFWAKAYIAEVTYREGKLKQAQQQVNELRSQTSDEDKLFFLEHLDSNLLYSLDKLAESLAKSKQLLTNKFVSENKVLQGTELLNIGSTFQALNKSEEALDYLTRSMIAYEQAKFTPGIAKAHYNIANVYMNTARFDLALDEYKKARESFKRCSMTGYSLMAKHRIATTSSLLGKYQNAKSELENLIDEYQAHGDEEGMILSSMDLAIIFFETEEYDLALNAIGKLLNRLETLEFPFYKNQSLSIAVRTSLMLGNIEDAEKYYSLIKESQRKDFRPGYILMPAFILHAKGELQQSVDQAIKIKTDIGEQWTETHEAKLSSLKESLTAGKRLPITYKN